ncbi:hypothetical protein [Ramlibacter sp.]|uniref:hypothetical protein n=1 Tax=Ramlibacter sp. TaxID=1917967 RepID=UPI002CDF3FBA|nr:hypothetical protein [Ramlibacter sp.]HWI83290.1 hypothetical protein [Ramlibacter sp.]
MASETAAARRPRWREWLDRARAPRVFWSLWAIAACGLLLLSELLWFWHSWPLRELLELDRIAGLSV